VSAAAVPARSFEAAFAHARDVEGWLTEAQARRLWDSALGTPTGGLVVEIGSFRGRSAIVLASALADGARLVAVDPHAGGDRGPREIEAEAARGEADNRAFLDNLERAGVASRVDHVRLPSAEALGSVDEPIDVLYVDGAHRFAPARDDLVGWGARVRGGGTMLVHDSFSSIGVTLATLSAVTFGSSWRYAGRSGSLAEYRRERVTGAARALNAVRQVAQLPWFARNVTVKALIVLRLRGGDWPY
jgi:predicted O-methyltransferase YrrM